MSLTLRADLSGLNSLLDSMAADVRDAIRPAAQAAAQVLYDDVQANVSKIGRKSGNLASSIYQVYSESNSNERRAVYQVSWNAKKAPHGGLVEFGHIQRYVVYRRRDGKFVTKVRAGMRGKKKPGRNASQAAKDAYYVPLKTPLQVAAKPFIRPAADKFDAAAAAARSKLFDYLLARRR